MAERYGRHHPLMEENQREIDSLERLRNDQIQAALASLRNQRDKAVTQEKQLADQLAAAEQESLRLDRIGVDSRRLRLRWACRRRSSASASMTTSRQVCSTSRGGIGRTSSLRQPCPISARSALRSLSQNTAAARRREASESSSAERKGTGARRIA